MFTPLAAGDAVCPWRTFSTCACRLVLRRNAIGHAFARILDNALGGKSVSRKLEMPDGGAKTPYPTYGLGAL